MTATFDTSLIPSLGTLPFVDMRDYARRELSKGDVLYTLGDDAEAVFRVEEGLVKQSIDLLTGRERITALAGPGDYLGATTPFALYGDSAEALSPKVTVSIILLDQLEADESLKKALYISSGIQLSRMREVLEDNDLPVTARLARTLLRLGYRFGQTDGQRVRLTLPLTHDHFAAMVGAARETTTALLSEMRSLDLITGTRGRYSFDRQALSEFAVAASLV